MLLIELAFPAGRYHATVWGRHVNEGIPEWPPSPYRMIRALYDAWKRKLPEWDEIRVERLLGMLGSDAPRYRLPPATASHTRSFLSKNEKDPQSKTLIFDGFVVLARRETVLMGWPDLTPDSADLKELGELLSRLNYLGRSESWIEAKILLRESGVEWNCVPQTEETPVPGSEIISVATAVPPSQYQPVTIGRGKTAKSLTWMDAIATGTDVILGSGWSHPPAMKYVNYRRPGDCFAAGISIASKPRDPKIYSVVYALDSKVLPQVTETLKVAERVRSRLMGIHKRWAGGPEHVSRKFSGKDRFGRPLECHQHAFYLPLDTDDDGRIDHLLVYCREPFDQLERAALNEFGDLWTRDGKPGVRCVPIQWDATRKKHRIFTSATPFVPAHYYRRGRGEFGEWLQAEIARECRNHGISDQVRVTGLPDLVVNGTRSIRWFEFRRNRKDDPVRSGFGLHLEFGQDVAGPFALGYGCHFGLGLFKAEE
jgi:CRISPR-associated protein Csb2